VGRRRRSGTNTAGGALHASFAFASSGDEFGLFDPHGLSSTPVVSSARRRAT
jgi:hypothetical protein